MAAACAICGRTILAGERVHGYVEGGEERDVCELCAARAERLGWLAAGEEPKRHDDLRHGGRGRLRGLLRRRPRRAGAPGPSLSAAAAPTADSAAPAAGSVAVADPAAPGRRTGSASAPAEEGPTPFERAVARFNSSEARRTVAGLARTLGTPSVSVGASAGAPDQVRVTVAWELSWYQWGVDVADELRPVFQLDKGHELDQLDPAARQWNASLGQDGRLGLAPMAARRG